MTSTRIPRCSGASSATSRHGFFTNVRASPAASFTSSELHQQRASPAGGLYPSVDNYTAGSIQVCMMASNILYRSRARHVGFTSQRGRLLHQARPPALPTLDSELILVCTALLSETPHCSVILNKPSIIHPVAMLCCLCLT